MWVETTAFALTQALGQRASAFELVGGANLEENQV